MNTKIFYSIDSGLFLWTKGTGILIDGLFTGDEFGWSVLPESLVDQLKRKSGIFAHCDATVYTHDHADHFNQDYFGLTQCYDPPMPYYSPWRISEYIQLERPEDGVERFKVGEIEIISIRTLHDGKGGEKFDHRSLLIKTEEETFFIPSDAVLDSTMVPFFQKYCDGPITAGFFNLFQIMSPKAQAFIREIGINRVMLYHLPFPEDDKFNYFNLARRAIKAYADDLPELELPVPMSWLDQACPDWAIREVGES